jgi:hypothetical protein
MQKDRFLATDLTNKVCGLLNIFRCQAPYFRYSDSLSGNVDANVKKVPSWNRIFATGDLLFDAGS